MANRFSNAICEIDYLDGGQLTTRFNGITNVDVALNTQTVAPAGGNAFDDLHNVVSQTPEITITSECLIGVLNNMIGIQGTCLGPVASGVNGLTIWTQAHDLCAAIPRVIAGNSKAVMGEGRVVVESVNAAPGTNATITFRGHGVSLTGATEPIVFTHGSETLPVPSDITGDTDNVMWSLGKVIVGGTTIDRITSVAVNYNLSILKPISSGMIYPLEVAVTKTSPTITITTEDVSLIDPGAFTQTGLAATHANTSIQFRKRADNGAFIADITAEHIKLTAAGIAYIQQVYSASGNATGTSVIGINTIDDGSNDPLVWDTAIAYAP